MDVTRPWFIDAWSVHDGRVFASRRPPTDDRDYLRHAGSTIFMSVPYLQAVPVGRISTALRATRSGFQEGFRDEDGAEIAFEALGQIRDLTRRAYLAAGLGPGSPGATAGPVPGPDVFDGPGGRLLEELVDERWDLLYDIRWVPEKDVVVGAIEESVDALAVASILDWGARLVAREPDPEAERALIGWIAALMRCQAFTGHDVNVDPYALVDRLGHALGEGWIADLMRPHLDRAPPGLGALDLAAGTYWTRGHLAVVPLPRSRRWDPRMRRLVEMQLYPTVSVSFWQHPRNAHELAPLLLAEMVQTRPSYLGRLRGDVPPVLVALEAVRRTAVPEPLPAAAESALEAFIEVCLDGSTGRRHPPRRLQARV